MTQLNQDDNQDHYDSDYISGLEQEQDIDVAKNLPKKKKSYRYYEDEDKYPTTFVGEMTKAIEFMWIYAITQLVL